LGIARRADTGPDAAVPWVLQFVINYRLISLDRKRAGCSPLVEA